MSYPNSKTCLLCMAGLIALVTVSVGAAMTAFPTLAVEPERGNDQDFGTLSTKQETGNGRNDINPRAMLAGLQTVCIVQTTAFEPSATESAGDNALSTNLLIVDFIFSASAPASVPSCSYVLDAGLSLALAGSGTAPATCVPSLNGSCSAGEPPRTSLADEPFQEVSRRNPPVHPASSIQVDAGTNASIQ